jgi:signal transduction histidine kinase
LKDKVERVLMNLLSNAFKYTKQGYVKLSVWSQTDSSSNLECLFCEVSDTGAGIRPEDLGKLFKPYMVLDRPSSIHSSGTFAIRCGLRNLRYWVRSGYCETILSVIGRRYSGYI